jgi:hypothetical protein
MGHRDLLSVPSAPIIAGVDVGYVCPHGRECIGFAGAPSYTVIPPRTASDRRTVLDIIVAPNAKALLHREKDGTLEEDPFSSALFNYQR